MYITFLIFVSPSVPSFAPEWFVDRHQQDQKHRVQPPWGRSSTSLLPVESDKWTSHPTSSSLCLGFFYSIWVKRGEFRPNLLIFSLCVVLCYIMLYQRCAVLSCAVLYCSKLRCALPCRAVLRCNALFCAVGAVLYCTVLYCTVLYCPLFILIFCGVMWFCLV